MGYKVIPRRDSNRMSTGQPLRRSRLVKDKWYVGPSLWFIRAYMIRFVAVFLFKGSFLFLLVLMTGCVILLWHSMCIPYNMLGVNYFNVR